MVNDYTEEGDADEAEFFDRFDLKLDEEVAEELGIGPEEGAKNKDGKKLSLDEFLKTANRRDFTEEQQAALLDEDNWTIRGGTKLDKLMSALYGQSWGEFVLEDLEGKEFIAKVHPRTGKRSGSYCGWDSFISLEPPKKKKKSKVDADLEAAEEQVEKDLAEAEEREMNAALGGEGDAA